MADEIEEKYFTVGPNPFIDSGNPCLIAGYTWLGTAPRDLPLPELAYGTGSVKLLREIAPELRLSREALLTLDDMAHAILVSVLDAAQKLGPYRRERTPTEDSEAKVTIRDARVLAGSMQYLVNVYDGGDYADIAWEDGAHLRKWPRMAAAMEEWNALSPTEKEYRSQGFYLGHNVDFRNPPQEEPVVIPLEGVSYEDAADDMTQDGIKSRQIQSAAYLVLSGLVCRRAVSLGTRAVMSIEGYGHIEDDYCFSIYAQLTLPTTVTAATAVAYTGRGMSRFAAVYLTAVIETVVHDLLKSSVELAVEAGATEIGNRCLLQAVNDNVDLKNLFGQCIILGAGHPQESIDPFVAGSAEEPVDPSRFVGTLEAQDVCRMMIGVPDVDNVSDNEESSTHPFAVSESEERGMADACGALDEEYSIPVIDPSFGCNSPLAPPQQQPQQATEEYSGAAAAADAPVIQPVPQKGATRGFGLHGVKRHRRIFRDTSSAVTREHLCGMAARAGTLAFTHRAAEEIRGCMIPFLHSVVKKALSRRSGRQGSMCGSEAVKITDVVAAFAHESHGAVCSILGTGRYGTALKATFTRTRWLHEAADYWDCYAFYELANEVDALQKHLSDREKGQDAAAAATDHALSVEAASEPPRQTGKIPEDDVAAAHSASLAYANTLRRSTLPVLPFAVFAGVLQETAQDVLTDAKFSPGAIRVFNDALEAHVVSVFREASLMAKHRGSAVVDGHDVRLALRVVG